MPKLFNKQCNMVKQLFHFLSIQDIKMFHATTSAHIITIHLQNIRKLKPHELYCTVK